MIAALRRAWRDFRIGFIRGYHAPERTYVHRFARAYIRQRELGRGMLAAFAIASQEAQHGAR